VWLQKLIVKGFIEEKIWEKHRVRRYEIEEALTHRQAIRLRHKKNPVRSVVVGATQGGRLLKVILEFQGNGRYFLVTAMELNVTEKRHYGKRIKSRS
jgi:hypothetical protein